MTIMISPTGLGIRGYDKWGSGAFGAPRGNHVHEGVDFICVPGQDIYAPSNGKIVREAHPYAGDLKWSGCLLITDYMEVKMFYMRLLRNMVLPISVIQGDIIGTAQNIADKYPGITPHVHLQVGNLNPEVLFK